MVFRGMKRTLPDFFFGGGGCFLRHDCYVRRHGKDWGNVPNDDASVSGTDEGGLFMYVTLLLYVTLLRT